MTNAYDYDWTDQRRKGELHAYMIPPTNLDDELGELTGIDWSASSFTSGYDTDTRTSGQLVLVGKGEEYIAPSFIRIIYEIPEWNYSREIGTYAVKQAPASNQNGQWKTTMELHSLLYTMDLDKAAKPLTLASNCWALDAMKSVLKRAHRESVLEDALDRQIGNTLVMESGQSQLSRMYTLCNLTDNRLDIDGHGRVTVTPYENPSSKTAQYTIDLGDQYGIAYDGVTRKSDFFELPSESVVIYKWTDTATNQQRELSSTAYVSKDGHADADVRGFNVTSIYNLTEMSPATTSRANQLASDFMESNSYESIEWSLRTKYLPVWEGDVIELIVPGRLLYSGCHKCLVKNADFSGPYMDVQLTLTEITGGE